MAALGLKHTPTAAVHSVVPGAGWPAVPAPPGAALVALLQQLDDSQWWPQSRLRAAQDQAIGALLAHARAQVPAWAERLGGLDLRPEALAEGGFEALPLLTRQDIQDLGAALQARELPPGHGARHAFPTSGSTGTPVTVWGTDLTQLFFGAINLRDHRWHRRDLAARFCAIRTKVEEAALDGWGGAVEAVYRTGPAFTLPIGRPLGEQLDWLIEHDPAYLITHPSNLAGLLHLSERSDRRPAALREALVFGEALPADLRESCLARWGAALTDRYTCEEAGYLALECPDVPGVYHVQAEHVCIEVLDDAGAPCPAGVPGRVAVTTLHHYATPLVRYLIGDYALAGPPCACGRGLPVLTRILGRVRNLVRLPDGSRHWPSFPAEDWLAIAPVRAFQLRQRTAKCIVARVVLERPLAPAEQDALSTMLRARLGYPFDISFESVPALERAPSGKFEDFVCDLVEPLP